MRVSGGLREQALGGVLLLGSQRVIGIVVTTLGGIVLARMLAPSVFGMYVVMMFAIGLGIAVADLGLGAALIQRRETDIAATLQAAFLAQMALSLCLVGVLVGSAPVVASLLGLAPESVSSFRVLALLLPLATLRMPVAVLLERQLNFTPATLSETLDVVTFNVVAVAAAASGWGVWSLVAGVLAARLSGAAVLYWYAGWYPAWQWHPARLGDLVRAGRPFQGTSFLVLARDAVVPVVVATWSGVTAVGLLNMAVTIAALPSHVVSLVGRVLFPLLSGLQNDLHRFASATERALNRVAAVMYPIAGILLAGAGTIVPLVLGERWVPSVPAVQLLCLSTIMGGTATVLVMALNSLGRAETVFRLNLLWTGGLWGLSLVLIPLLGFVGYAVASVCQAATGVLALRELRRVIPLRVWNPIGAPCVASAASALVVWGLVPWIHTLSALLAGGLLALAVYAGLVAWMGGAGWRAEVREDWNNLTGSRGPGRA